MGLLTSRLSYAFPFGLEETDPAKSQSEPHILYSGGVVIFLMHTACLFPLRFLYRERERAL